MADEFTKKKRSRSGIIGYINKIIKNTINPIYDSYLDEHLLTLISRKDVIEEKLQTVVKLLEQIQE